MRNKTVSFAGKDIRVEEKKIGELEKAIATLFPESGGNIQKIDLDKILERVGFELFYEEIPKLFPGISKDDVVNAYVSEVEELIEAFVEVNFTGVKKVLAPVMSLVQMGASLPQK